MMTKQKLDAFQVIADPSRRQLMQLLSKDSMTINSLAKNFDMSRPAISKHLKIMCNAGFISITDIGRERYCTLKQDGFHELQEFINYFEPFWTGRLRKLEVLLNSKTKAGMKAQDYKTTIRVNATPEETYKKIANVGDWWAKSFTGKALHVGDTFRIEFGATWVNFKITEAIREKKVVWHVTDSYLPWLSNKTEWTNTKVVFEISAEGNFTRINFTHIGLVPGIECYERCETGWTRFITISLPKFLNEGKGLPE